MVQRVATVAFEGVEARAVDVQVQVAAGMPAFTIVGLPDKAVSEARERVRSALIASGLLVGYFVLRFPVLHIGGPGLIERSSGYGFHTLEPQQLVQTFGANPIGFYAYNIVTSALSVLFAEPRAGMFDLTRGIVQGAVNPALYGVPTVPEGSELVVTTTGPDLIVRLSAAPGDVAGGLAESLACTVTVPLKAAVGVPVIWLPLTERGEGSPETMNV